MILGNEIEGYLLPLGTLGFLCQQIAAGRAGLLTQVGLQTYMDPDSGGARLNERTQEEIVGRETVGGEDYLWLKAFPVDVAIVRGTTVDTRGNLSLEGEHATMNIFYQALAAKRSGGTVIVQAARMVEEGQIPPRMVAVPGMLVDAIVIDPGQHGDEGNPRMDWLLPWDRLPRPPTNVLASPNPDVWLRWFTERTVDQGAVQPPVPDSADEIIARRAALEITPGSVVNIGAGVAARDLLPVAVLENIDEDCILSIEPGHLGGWVNGALLRAGTQAILSTPDIFSVYGAGLIGGTFLSMLEFDAAGNVNLLRYGDTLVGPGGSMDIGEGAPKIVFCGTLTARGLRARGQDGELRIDAEGSIARAVGAVEAVCFSGERMRRQGKQVLYVTERAVFELTQEGVTVREIAPGIDLETDVIAQMAFRPIVPENISTMDARIYQAGLMGLRPEWDTVIASSATRTASGSGA